MGDVEYLVQYFYRYVDSAVYPITCVLLMFVIWVFWRKGGLPKPKKEDIWVWVQDIIDYFENRKGK